MSTPTLSFIPAALRLQNDPYALCSGTEPSATGRMGVDMSHVTADAWESLQLADVVLATGIGTTAYPLIGEKLLSAQIRGAKLILVTSHHSPVSLAADLHLRIRPGTNVALANAILCLLIEEGYLDERYIHERTTGFGEAVNEALNMCPARAADICGVDRGDIRKAAVWYGEAQSAMILHSWCAERPLEGLYALSYLNLVHATGRADKPGCGYVALTGRGGCPSSDVSCRVLGAGYPDSFDKAHFYALRYQQPAAEAPGGDRSCEAYH